MLSREEQPYVPPDDSRPARWTAAKRRVVELVSEVYALRAAAERAPAAHVPPHRGQPLPPHGAHLLHGAPPPPPPPRDDRLPEGATQRVYKAAAAVDAQQRAARFAVLQPLTERPLVLQHHQAGHAVPDLDAVASLIVGSQAGWAHVYSDGKSTRALVPGIASKYSMAHATLTRCVEDRLHDAMGRLAAQAAATPVDAFQLQLRCWDLDIRLIVYLLGGEASLHEVQHTHMIAHEGERGDMNDDKSVRHALVDCEELFLAPIWGTAGGATMYTGAELTSLGAFGIKGIFREARAAGVHTDSLLIALGHAFRRIAREAVDRRHRPESGVPAVMNALRERVALQLPTLGNRDAARQEGARAAGAGPATPTAADPLQIRMLYSINCGEPQIERLLSLTSGLQRALDVQRGPDGRASRVAGRPESRGRRDDDEVALYSGLGVLAADSRAPSRAGDASPRAPRPRDERRAWESPLAGRDRDGRSRSRDADRDADRGRRRDASRDDERGNRDRSRDRGDADRDADRGRRRDASRDDERGNRDRSRDRGDRDRSLSRGRSLRLETEGGATAAFRLECDQRRLPATCSHAAILRRGCTQDGCRRCASAEWPPRDARYADAIRAVRQRAAETLLPTLHDPG